MSVECLRLPAPCPDPGRPYQGDRFGDDFRHDRTVTFTCPKDYIMEGLPTITCSDGRWRYRKPSCKGKLYFVFKRVEVFFFHPPGQYLAKRDKFRLEADTKLPCLVLVFLFVIVVIFFAEVDVNVVTQVADSFLTKHIRGIWHGDDSPGLR